MVPPAQPAAIATVDCVVGITVETTNTGGEQATLTIAIDGNVVGELVTHAGGTETFVFDLNPADAGTAKTIQVFHGDVAILDQVLEVQCGSIAGTPCEAAAAGSPAIDGNTDTGCTNPCWWAPFGLLAGVVIGRRRRDGRYNPAGIAAGTAGLFFTLTSVGAAPLGWALFAALALAGAVKYARRNRDDVEDVAGTEDTEAPAKVETP